MNKFSALIFFNFWSLKLWIRMDLDWYSAYDIGSGSGISKSGSETLGTRLKFLYKNVCCLASQQPSQCDTWALRTYDLRENMMDFRFLGCLCHCLNNTLFSGPRVPVWTWIPGPLPGPPIDNENYLQPPSDSCDPKIQYFFLLWIQSFGGRFSAQERVSEW